MRKAARVERARYSFGSVEPNPSSSLIIVSAHSSRSDDDVDHSLEVQALEALRRVDLTDLLALALGHQPDVELLAARVLALLALGA